MATLKHINSKNADYGAAEQYLLFEHDEFTMKPVLDETGRLIPREDYRLSTLNCGGEDFAVACILFCVLELGDGEIGDLMGMSRSAVQRHRAKTLNELRKKLKAHLPEGG